MAHAFLQTALLLLILQSTAHLGLPAQTAAPSEATPKEGRPAADPDSARIQRLVTKGGVASYIFNRVGRVTIGVAQLDVSSPDPHSVSFSGSVNIGQNSFGMPQFGQVAGALRWNPATNRYLFSLSVGEPTVTDMPLTYSEETGFTGTGPLHLDGTTYDAKVSIASDDAKKEHVWTVATTDDKVSFRFTFRNKVPE